MQPVFDAYVMVDWSAAAQPVRGAQSIWIYGLERRDGAMIEIARRNPPTRDAAVAELADLFSDLIARDRVTLAGFDFAFGYPAGFARSLARGHSDWRAVWAELSSRVKDGEDNANNRFALAADFNARLSGRAFPFWGRPDACASPLLDACKPDGYGEDSLAEYRLTERVALAPKSVWQMAYAGSVGGQTLLGIPRLYALRHHPWLTATTRIWPFETGLKPLARPGADGWRLLLAETYPAMVAVRPQPGEVRDLAGVRTLAHHFAERDRDGRLAELFAGPSTLSAEERQRIETEEAWILGIETGADGRSAGSAGRRGAYLRQPAAIYERSFALVRAESDFSALPADVRKVAERLVHACGDPSITADLRASEGVVAAARAALAQGAPILCDSAMVAAGIIVGRLPARNRVLCTLTDPAVAAASEAAQTTRSAAAVDLWGADLDGAVVAIGNAPTALFRLLERLDEGAPRPAAILAFPVGFVGAAESKEALIADPLGIPYLTLRGRRGGSALAAAAVNALAGESG